MPRKLEDFSQNETYLTSLVFALILISAIVNIITSIITKTSYQSIFSSFNFVQIMLLIPLTEVYLPLKVTRLIEAMNPALLSFYYLDCEDASLKSDMLGECSYAQPNSVLSFIGVESGSTLINIHVVIIILILIVITHLLVLPFYC